MNKMLILEGVWEQLSPFLADIAKTYPKIETIWAVQFRGYNSKSANCPKKRNTISLWVNMYSGTKADEALRRRNAKLLNTIWEQLIKELGDDVDRVMIVPVGTTLYIPGIYPADIRGFHDLPSYRIPPR